MLLVPTLVLLLSSVLGFLFVAYSPGAKASLGPERFLFGLGSYLDQMAMLPLDLAVTWGAWRITNLESRQKWTLGVIAYCSVVAVILGCIAFSQYREGRLLTGHRNDITCVAFSPDGKTLASASADKTIILWDVARGQPLGPPLTGHTYMVDHVAFSPDGKTLASASMDEAVMLWDVRSRQPLGPPLTRHHHGLHNVAFSPDGQLLASGSSDRTIILWDVTRRQLLGPPLNEHVSGVRSVAFSPDGKTLASSGDGIILWDVASRQPLGPRLARKQGVTSVAFSPDGKLLAYGGWDHNIRIYNMSNLRLAERGKEVM